MINFLMSFGYHTETLNRELAVKGDKMKRRLEKIAYKKRRQGEKNQRLLEKMGIKPKRVCCSYRHSSTLPHVRPDGVEVM